MPTLSSLVDPTKVTIRSDGRVSEIHFATDGTASWNCGELGGRVGELAFRRARVP